MSATSQVITNTPTYPQRGMASRGAWATAELGVARNVLERVVSVLIILFVRHRRQLMLILYCKLKSDSCFLQHGLLSVKAETRGRLVPWHMSARRVGRVSRDPTLLAVKVAQQLSRDIACKKDCLFIAICVFCDCMIFCRNDWRLQT